MEQGWSRQRDKTAVVWDLNAGEPMRLFGHSWPVRSIAFGPGAYVASGGDDKLRIWDPPALPKSARRHLVGAVTHLGSILVSAGDDGAMAMWDGGGAAPTAKTTPRLLRGPGRIWALTALGGYNGLISGDDGAILQWNPETGTAGGLLMGHSLPVTSIALRPDGKELLSGGLDGRVLRWRPQNERKVTAGPATAEEVPAAARAHQRAYQIFAAAPGPAAGHVWHPCRRRTRPDARACTSSSTPTRTRRNASASRLTGRSRGDFDSRPAEVVRADQRKMAASAYHDCRSRRNGEMLN